MNLNKKRIIGLTGGIGSGKSTVSNYLREKNITIVDADVIGKQVVEPGMPALLEIRAQFGMAVFYPDGRLNRKALAGIVFSDSQKLKALNKIMHHRIGQVIKEQLENSNTEITVLDAPLLLENNMESMVDEVWVMYTADDTRVARVMKRDEVSEKDIFARMENQMTQKERAAKADRVIYNNGTLQDLYCEMDEILNEK